MTIYRFLQKLFVGGSWFVGIRNHTETTSNEYNIVEMPDMQWIADPFLYEYNGRHYLFVEQYFNARNRAALGVFEIIKGKAMNNSIIVDNPYHMSYPNVFHYKGGHWMIPESSSNQSLDLYRCISFPDKWECAKTLLRGCRVVDTTTYIHNDKVYLLSYEKVVDGWVLHVNLLDMYTYSLSHVADKIYSDNVGRPAGQLFEEKGKLYRPAQNCTSKYGESILIYEITDISPNSYNEILVKEIRKEDVHSNIEFERIHTYNRDTQYEVIDLFQEHFDVLHWWKIFKRKYLKK